MPEPQTPFRTVLLDERGDSSSSEEFAELLARWRDDGVREARFVIGAADGHDARRARRAPTCCSRSARRPGRTCWPARCCSSSCSARPASLPAIPIIGQDSARDARALPCSPLVAALLLGGASLAAVAGAQRAAAPTARPKPAPRCASALAERRAAEARSARLEREADERARRRRADRARGRRARRADPAGRGRDRRRRGADRADRRASARRCASSSAASSSRWCA